MLVGQELFVCKACLVQQRASDLTVGAGSGGEQPCAVVCVLRGSRLAAAGLFCIDGTLVSQLRTCNVVNLTILVLLCLTVVPVLNGTVVTGDTAVNLGPSAGMPCALFHTPPWMVI